MNRLWPKLSTSIRPNTSVRPEAAMKMIMPIARPATVSVSQVELEPTAGQAASAITATSTSGRKSKRVCGSASAAAGAARARWRRGARSWPRPHWWVASDRPSRRVLQRLVVGQRRPSSPRWTTRPSSITATRVAERRGHGEVLLDQQDRRRGALQLAQRGDQVLHDRRRQALARLVDQQQPARLDHRAGDRQHLLLPARELAGRVEPELLQRREEARTATRAGSCRARPRSSPARAASSMFSRTVRSAKMPMFSGT